MSFILLGKIINTHGLKGELRIISDFKYKDRILKPNAYLYLGKEKIREKIISYRKHKNYDMVCFQGYVNINEILKYKGKFVFIAKEDLLLKDNEYLNEDLINLEVFCDKKLVGKVIRIDNYSNNEVIVIKNDKKEYLIPYVFDIIETINLEKGNIIIKNIKGLIE